MFDVSSSQPVGLNLRMVTFHQLILWLLSLLCRPWGCPKRLAQSVQLMKRRGQMEILKSVMRALVDVFSASSLLRCWGQQMLRVTWTLNGMVGFSWGLKYRSCCLLIWLQEPDLTSQNFASFRAFLLSKAFCQHDSA